MKKLILTILCAIAIVSCNPPQEKSLTTEIKANIEKDISNIVDSIAKSASELRTDYFKKIYWSDDQFIGVDLTGAKGYETYMKETDEMYSNMKNINFKEDKVSIIVYDDKTAMALFEGSAKGESKTGAKMNLNNFNASMLFRKIDGQWKLVYTHESADQEIMMP